MVKPEGVARGLPSDLRRVEDGHLAAARGLIREHRPAARVFIPPRFEVVGMSWHVTVQRPITDCHPSPRADAMARDLLATYQRLPFRSDPLHEQAAETYDYPYF